MYESYFGLKGRPFRLSPDPDFFFASATHSKGLAYLRYGLLQGEGFVIVTGVPGTGKTTLINTLTKELPESEFLVAKLNNALLTVDDLFRTITRLFGLKTIGNRKVELLEELETYLLQQARLGKRMLLLIDEAHNLTPQILEELRLLTNLQHKEKYILQIFLLGQLQLEDTLHLPEMLQLRQRVLVSHRLEAIACEEIGSYIKHRLETAGWNGHPFFSNEAYWLIHHYAEGIPRQINTLSDRILLYAYLEEKDKIDRAVIECVIDELKLEPASYVHGRLFTEERECPVSFLDMNESDEIRPRNILTNTPDVESGVGKSVATLTHSQNFLNVVSWRSNTARKINGSVAESLNNSPDSLVVRMPAEVVVRQPQVNLLLPKNSNRENDDAHSVDAIVNSDVLPEESCIANSSTALNSADNSLIGCEVLYKQRDDATQSRQRISGFVAYLLSQWQGQKSLGMIAGSTAIGLMMLLALLSWVPSFEKTQSVAISEFASLELVSSPELKYENTVDVTDANLFNENNQEVLRITDDENVALDLPMNVDSELEEPVAEIADKGENQLEEIFPVIEEYFVAKETSAHSTLDVSLPKSDAMENKASSRVIGPLIAEPVKIDVKKATKLKTDDRNSESKKVKVPETLLATKPEEQSVMPAELNVPSVVALGNSTPESNSPSFRPSLSEDDFVELLRRFKLSYQEGDLNDFLEIFSQDVASNDIAGIEALQSDYEKLFSVTDFREIDFSNVNWDSGSQRATGEGVFQLKVREKGGRKLTSYSGKIELEIDQSGTQPLIRKIIYSYSD